MHAHDAAIGYRIPPKPRLSRVVREGVAGFARSYGVAEDDLSPLVTALGEALANAMEHAGASDAVDVAVRVGTDRIVATVQDRGVGFPAAPAIKEAVLPKDDCERGRGLAIMRRCCDVFDVKSSPGRGTLVVLGRYRRDGRRTAAVA